MKPVFVHDPGYDISLPLIDRFHPFDGRKFSRAHALACQLMGERCQAWTESPGAAAGDEALLRVHTPQYLASLADPGVVAQALEVKLLGLLPRSLIQERILKPMRLAVAGTILATQRALQGAIALNFGGGFHHAFAAHGEGFCLYADVAVAIAAARASNLLAASDPIAIIDLDAHRGNGVWALCGAEPATRVLDVYNGQAYPGPFPGDSEAYPFQIAVQAGTRDDRYLAIVREALPMFLDQHPAPCLAVYNAGTDIVAGDPLGGLAVSPEGVTLRDRLVVRALAERGIPTLVVTSGGYTEISHRLVAQLAVEIAEALWGSEEGAGLGADPRRPSPGG